MNKKHLLIFLLISIFTCSILQAQPRYKVSNYSLDEGFSQKIISDILQDKNGFMWFSTWNGLSRFDGYTIVNYKKSLDNRNIPHNNRIDFIRENSEGNIWCYTNDKRVYLFDTRTNRYIDILKKTEQKMKRQYEVNAIYPLKKGVTWIVCDEGIAFRIDDKGCIEEQGINMYTSYDKALQGNVILGIVQDTDGDEWILTNKGITVVGQKDIKTSTPFRYIDVQKDQILLASENGRLAIYNQNTKKLRHIKTPSNVNQISKVTYTTNGVYAMVTNRGLLIYDSHKNLYQFPQVMTASGMTPLKDIYYSDSGHLWAFTTEPLVLKIDIKTGNIQKIRFKDNQSTILIINNKSQVYESDKILWCITSDDHCLAYYDPKTETIRKTSVDSNGFVLGNNWLRGLLYTDNQHNIWMPAISGVTKVSFLKNNIEHIELDKNFETRSFMYDKKERLWAGTKAGIIRVYDKESKFIGYLAPNGQITQKKILFSNTDIGIYSMMEDSSGNIWIGTKGNGLYQLQPNDENGNSFSVKNYTNNPSDLYSLSNNNVYSIFEDDKKRIWIGSYNGGLNLIVEKDKIKFLNQNNLLKNYPIEDFASIRHITETKDKVMCIATTRGLLTFSSDFTNPATITYFKNQPDWEKKTSLSGYNIMQTLSDRKGNIYVTTSDGGINKIVSKNLLSDNIEFQLLGKTDSSITSYLNLSMAEDSNGNLWGISENSIARINPNNGDINIISRNLLISNCYFTEGIPLLLKNKMIVATGSGMLIIHTDEMTPNYYAPPIAFTDINSQGERIETDTDGSLSLLPSQRNISITFAALDYIYAKDICYAYRMLGVDSSWTYIDKNRSVSYANLSKGDYRFQVKSTNSDGIWQNNIKTLTIHVKPKFRETYWATLLFILSGLLLATIIMYTIFYIYRLRYNLNFEQQLADIKLRFFTDISHELRTPLTLISGPLTEVIENENLSSTAAEYLNIVKSNVSRMLLLINQILDFRKMQNKKMKLFVENADVVEFTQKIMLDFRFIAEEKQINFELESNSNSIWCWIDTDKFKKILFNLLSNAFKYTPNSRSIKVNLTETNEEVFVSVIDQGIGINSKKISTIFERFENYAMYNSEQPSSGIGLSLVRELANLHHAKIMVESAEKQGSEFKVIFKKGIKHLQNDDNIEFILSDYANSEVEDNDLPAMELDEDASSDTSSQLTILVVEDNVELQNFLVSILSHLYKVIVASNGYDGYMKAKDTIPDFILTDVVMKNMDGLEMVKKIKEDTTICHIPIIVLSSKSSIDDKVKGIEHGIDDYITKPFSATYLKTRISMLIKQRIQLQEIYMTAITESDITSVNINPSQPQIIPSDKIFIQQLIRFMEQNMDNANLTIDDMAEFMNQSRSIFYRKIKSILGVSPIDFIRKIRIKRAVQLIESDEYTLSQIAYMTGFSDPKYFGKCFKKETGKNPSEYKTK